MENYLVLRFGLACVLLLAHTNTSECFQFCIDLGGYETLVATAELVKLHRIVG